MHFLVGPDHRRFDPCPHFQTAEAICTTSAAKRGTRTGVPVYVVIV